MMSAGETGKWDSRGTEPVPEIEEEEEEERTKETSILFEPFTTWVLLACLLVAIWFKFLPLIAIVSFLLILSVVIITWRERALKNLDIALESSKSRLFAGDEFVVHASVKNDKWLPLIWLEWEFQSSKALVWGDDFQDTYIVRFLWLLSYQQVTWTVKGKGLKRGVYNIGHVTVRSGDGFRFSEKGQVRELNKNLYVYPKLTPVRVPEFRPAQQSGLKGMQGGFLEDPLLVSGIRGYEAGDEWKRINWRASARTGEMQTNVYQPVVSKKLIVYMDVQGFLVDEEKHLVEQQKYKRQKEETFERFLSIVASFAMAFHEKGMEIGYGSNGLDLVGRKQLHIQATTQITPILDQIAQLTQRVYKEEKAPLDTMVHNSQHAVPMYVFCESITKAHYLWYERNKQKHNIHFYYIGSNEFSEKLTGVARQIDVLLAEPVVSGL